MRLINDHDCGWIKSLPKRTNIKTLNKNVICENDANCFALSEAFDGSAKNYNIVFVNNIII